MQITVITCLWCNGNPVPGVHLLPSVYLLMELSKNKAFLTHTTSARTAEPELKAGACSREASLELDLKLPQHLHSARARGWWKQISDEWPSFLPHCIFPTIVAKKQYLLSWESYLIRWYYIIVLWHGYHPLLHWKKKLTKKCDFSSLKQLNKCQPLEYSGHRPGLHPCFHSEAPVTLWN